MENFNQNQIDGKDEWLTDPEIIKSLGDFDLDPCAPINRPWDIAKNHYTIKDDGLFLEWHGRVWLNPPYGRETKEWMRKMAEHKNGIALIYARTDTKYWHDYIFNVANVGLFLKGRLNFFHVDGTKSKNSGGAPSVLIAYGENNIEPLINSGLKGFPVYLK